MWMTRPCRPSRGGRPPRLLTPADENHVIQTAATRPAELGQPFTRWPLRKRAAYLRRVRFPSVRRESGSCGLDVEVRGAEFDAQTQQIPVRSGPSVGHCRCCQRLHTSRPWARRTIGMWM
ncbi:hypothetical protein GCM10010424_53420 [Streptomyces lienomycini]